MLSDVACRSSADCWAVGSYTLPSEDGIVSRNEALHWNGRKWALEHTPDPAGTTGNDANWLAGVRCPAAHNCIAVGVMDTVTDTGTADLNEVLHWDGKKWRTVAVPSPGPANGGGFSELASLTCTSPASCWAAGVYGTVGDNMPSTILSQVLHWNGSRWSRASIPEPGGTSGFASQGLVGITCASAADCWAVGDYVPSGGVGLATLNQALHWDGDTWSLVATPDPGGVDSSGFSELAGVRCAGRANCWAVGLIELPAGVSSQVLHWDGATWSAG
jgi:hypothetical protein